MDLMATAYIHGQQIMVSVGFEIFLVCEFQKHESWLTATTQTLGARNNYPLSLYTAMLKALSRIWPLKEKGQKWVEARFNDDAF